jgi:23S rRNA (uracil1939-C5)-methyltransferase
MQALTDYIKANLHRLQVSYPYNLIIRQSSHTKGLMVIFKGKKLGPIKTDWLQEYKGLESVYAIENNKQALLWGRPYLYEEIGGINYRLSPLSFFQVNHVQTSKMINLVYANINRTDSLLDAYCGVGSIALYLSGKAHKVVGVENFLPAVENARSNAALNNISNCNFICGACEQIIPAITEQFDAVVIDPPRAGCNGDLMEALIKQAPSEVLYISCNPATLARDLKQMASYYRIKLIQPIDMFPQTYHVETVVLMSKVDK